jgi:MFS family permease
VGPATGALLGNAAFLLVTLLPKEDLLAWGWRIPFLFSFVLVIVGSLAAIASIFMMFAAVATAQPWLVGLAYALGFGWLYTICYGLQPALFADAFPAEVRFTGMSLGYQLANVVGSGFTPMIAVWLVHSTGNFHAVPVFVAVTLAISLVCLLRLAALAQARKAAEETASPENSSLVATR